MTIWEHLCQDLARVLGEVSLVLVAGLYYLQQTEVLGDSRYNLLGMDVEEAVSVHVEYEDL